MKIIKIVFIGNSFDRFLMFEQRSSCSYMNDNIICKCNNTHQPYNEIWRTSVIKELVKTNLNVISYGLCSRNTRQSKWHLTVMTSTECRRHRIMLAVENNACRDWISQNLCNAVSHCGAIPIIKSIWGNGMLMPDYKALYGNFPYINASHPGWLDEVKKIMRNDTYYVEKLTKWKKKPASHIPTNFHCQWHEMKSDKKQVLPYFNSSIQVAPFPRDKGPYNWRNFHDETGLITNRKNGMQWQQCVCPQGHRYLNQKSKWQENCNTPTR